MRSLFFLAYPWGLILQAIAIVHFIRRRPDFYWLWIVLFFGPLGALIYIFIEVIPDFTLLRHSFDTFSRQKKIKHLEALVQVNPAAGNYEELGDVYLDERKYAQARECYSKAISTSRDDSMHPYYRRGIAEIQLNDFPAALADLEYVVSRDQKYDFYRALALLAHTYANTGNPEKADELFRLATEKSTASETYLNYATFLASQQRPAEAKEWAQRVLAKKPTMPGYLRRRERAWFHGANKLLKRLGQWASS